MNKVILTGRLTRDPELTTATDKNGPYKIAKYDLALDKGKDNAMFFPCTAFRHNAEFAEKYLKKGMKILVCGSLEQSTYTDKETGKNRSKIQVIVNEHEFAESKKDGDTASQTTEPAQAPAQAPVQAPVQTAQTAPAPAQVAAAACKMPWD